MMGWFQGPGSMAGLGGMFMMLLIWGALIWFAVWSIARFTRSESASQVPGEPARVVLDRRLARGEIDIDEYARCRRALEGSGPSDVMPKGS